jgi:predicted signal transduction protein with EAL and GGDEF domain
MTGRKFPNVGDRSPTGATTSNEKQVPPPIPIVRSETETMRALQAEFAAVQRQENTCCLVIVRPDPAEGVFEQSILAVVGKRFSQGLRPYDGLFAFGSDRYLISLPRIEPEDAVAVMNRLREQIANEPLEVVDGGAVGIAASVGGTMIDTALPLQDNIDRADQALYEAWRKGGNRVCLWTPDLGVV